MDLLNNAIDEVIIGGNSRHIEIWKDVVFGTIKTLRRTERLAPARIFLLKSLDSNKELLHYHSVKEIYNNFDKAMENSRYLLGNIAAITKHKRINKKFMILENNYKDTRGSNGKEKE